MSLQQVVLLTASVHKRESGATSLHPLHRIRAGAKETLIIHQNLLTFLYLDSCVFSCGYKIILVLEAKYFVCRSPLKILGVAS